MEWNGIELNWVNAYLKASFGQACRYPIEKKFAYLSRFGGRKRVCLLCPARGTHTPPSQRKSRCDEHPVVRYRRAAPQKSERISKSRHDAMMGWAFACLPFPLLSFLKRHYDMSRLSAGERRRRESQMRRVASSPPCRHRCRKSEHSNGPKLSCSRLSRYIALHVAHPLPFILACWTHHCPERHGGASAAAAALITPPTPGVLVVAIMMPTP